MTGQRARVRSKRVRVLHKSVDSAVQDWERHGWQLTGQTSSRMRTELTFEKRRPTGRRSRIVLSAAVVLALLVVVSYVFVDRSPGLRDDRTQEAAPRVQGPVDGDGDGITDADEIAGWRTFNGSVYTTDPDRADTDSDGLPDSDEAGVLGTDPQTHNLYSGFSNPRNPDSDDDGLADAVEADLELQPFDPDTDGDGLEDGYEVDVIGTSPLAEDTDGDGFDDFFEDTDLAEQGLDPLWIDVKIDRSVYVADYAKGLVLGDLNREDSLAWLAGNLTSGAASSVPVVGSVAGGLTDARDVVGSAIRADWVGSGFSAVGAVPGGDLVAVPGKAAKFVARNPELAVSVASLIALSTKIPHAIKVKAAKAVSPRWDELRSAGASEAALLRLQGGRVDSEKLADAIRRPGHTGAGTAPFMARGADGEAFLENLYDASAKGVTSQVWASTAAFMGRGRFFDVLIDGVAHESKVGYVRWTPTIENQIRKDAWLIDQGSIEDAQWHFFASGASNTIGADTRVLDLLDELGIRYTLRLPDSA